MSTVRKLFVVGVGRSGTSLLQAMFGSHGEIAFLPETGYVRRYLLREVSTPSMTPESLDAFLHALEADERASRWPLQGAGLRTACEAARERASARAWSAARCTYEVVAEAGGAGHRYVGDKDPRNIEDLEGLVALWPECRIVHLVRDPRDVLLSRKKAAWSREHHLGRQLAACAVQFRLGSRAAPALGHERLRMLRYEDLLADPASALRELCNWLGIDFEPAMLDFGATASALVAPEEMAWKSETLGPLLDRNSRKWATGLTPFEIAATERACAQAMDRGGYAASDGARSLAGAAFGRSIALCARGYVAARPAARSEGAAGPGR